MHQLCIMALLVLSLSDLLMKPTLAYESTILEDI